MYHVFSIGFKSGENAGHFMWFRLCPSRKIVTILAPWGRALSSMLLLLLLLCCDSLDGQVARSLERRHVVCWLIIFVMVFICWASFCSGSLSSAIIGVHDSEPRSHFGSHGHDTGFQNSIMIVYDIHIPLNDAELCSLRC